MSWNYWNKANPNKTGSTYHELLPTHDDVIKWKHFPRYWPFVREFPTQRPVTRSFDVFFALRLNKRLSKQPRGWWFETPSWSLWRQCNESHRYVRIVVILDELAACARDELAGIYDLQVIIDLIWIISKSSIRPIIGKKSVRLSYVRCFQQVPPGNIATTLPDWWVIIAALSQSGPQLV